MVSNNMHCGVFAENLSLKQTYINTHTHTEGKHSKTLTIGESG